MAYVFCVFLEIPYARNRVQVVIYSQQSKQQVSCEDFRGIHIILASFCQFHFMGQ